MAFMIDDNPAQATSARIPQNDAPDPEHIPPARRVDNAYMRIRPDERPDLWIESASDHMRDQYVTTYQLDRAFPCTSPAAINQ